MQLIGDDEVIDRLYAKQVELLEYLISQKQLSYKLDVEYEYKKSLVVSIASFFETSIQNMIVEYCNKVSSDDKLLYELVKKKAIDRQYHTYFAWGTPNANQFFSHFGKEFKDRLNKEINKNNSLKSGEAAFMYIGSERNKLVHQNFATGGIEKNINEIFDEYSKGKIFVNFLIKEFGLS